ncbi:small ribosomal subunit protein eS7-like isoform X1 [Primulina tabacum]|uniref:small ribosomal subunit protein eS7-like isoform X1 n=2 Tax=Primulina tabacum TaxID=48773 RepID=UPI003F59B7DB
MFHSISTKPSSLQNQTALFLPITRRRQGSGDPFKGPVIIIHFDCSTPNARSTSFLQLFCRAAYSFKMYTALQKIHKDKDAEPSEFEETVAQALFDLENTNQEIKSDLKDLYINSALQVDVSGGKKAVVIHVPYRLRKAFRKIQPRLVRELEKKFSGKEVVLIATRRIVRPPKKGSAVQRPRTRTLTAVHEAMMEDVVYPAEIVGKRIRYRLDGSKIMKVFLDPKSKNDTESKLETFAGVYRKLSGKEVIFEFPVTEA